MREVLLDPSEEVKDDTIGFSRLTCGEDGATKGHLETFSILEERLRERSLEAFRG